MKRATREKLAKETVEIVKAGTYTTLSGRVVEIGPAVERCLSSTRFLTPEELEALRSEMLARPSAGLATIVEIVNETTLVGVNRLLTAGSGPVAVLNFASAKNPGGGFLNGSQAQEESLARNSALYASLLRGWQFYERHRASASPLYSDAMILSPDCPIFRDDEGTLLEEPHLASFITSAAPNAGAAARNAPAEVSRIPDVLRQRSEYVLALAASQGYQRLVLGAWGCGVFRNDPSVVATAFADHLRGAWAGRFERIVFSVMDKSDALETFIAFKTRLATS